MAKLLKDLIEDITQDDLPTNEFTIEDEDPMVILGKLNEVISKLTEIRDLIGDSDSKANEALTAALEALTNSQEALSNVNIAVDTSNTAIATANEAIASANEALSQATAAFNAATQAGTDATGALEAANQAKQDATNASISANDANDKADIAITDSSNALAFASNADSKADVAITTADSANTKADGAVTASNEAKSKAEDANNTANSANDYAINADSNAADAKRIAQEALDKVVEGTGTTIIDYSGNKLKNAKFKGSTSINVDMSATDPHEFEFRVDKTILDDIDIKLNKVTEKEKVYGTDGIGNQTTIQYNVDAIGGGLAKRTDGGQLKVNDAVNDNEAVSKSQLNTINNNVVAINLKATANEEAIETINTTLPNKANVNYVDDALALKANTQYVNTELEKKANKDLSNVTYPTNTAGATKTGTADRVIETYISSDGKTWYRKWASGWKECSGYISGGGDPVTVTMPLSFDKQPFITKQCGWTGYYGRADESFSYSQVWNVNTNSSGRYNRFSTTMGIAGSGGEFKYYACGY